jgi:hypothetical protein
LEVERADEDLVGPPVGQADLGVVVVGHLAGLHPCGVQSIAILLQRSGATWNATWFMEPMALVSDP